VEFRHTTVEVDQEGTSLVALCPEEGGGGAGLVPEEGDFLLGVECIPMVRRKIIGSHVVMIVGWVLGTATAPTTGRSLTGLHLLNVVAGLSRGIGVGIERGPWIGTRGDLSAGSMTGIRTEIQPEILTGRDIMIGTGDGDDIVNGDFN